MIFRVLGFEDELVRESFSHTRKVLHRLWLDWLIANPVAETKLDRFEQLKQLFYVDLGFTGDWQQYYHSDSLLIFKALQRRSGSASSLAILLDYFARKLDLECKLVQFPAQAILKFSLDQDAFYFDPFKAETVNQQQLTLMHRGYSGDLAMLREKDLEELGSNQVAERWLSELKTAFIREQKFEFALNASQLLLRLKPGDPLEMRDRGFIFQQLDCHSVAINDFEYFIEQCPDDPLSKLLRMQIHSMDDQPATLH